MKLLSVCSVVAPPVVALAALLLTACASTPPAAKAPPLPLIPMPAHVARVPGHFVLRAGASVIVESGNVRALGIARYFANLVARTRNIRLDVRAVNKPADDRDAIVLALDSNNLLAPGGEGYRLTVRDHRIRVAARDPAGLFYGTVTLWQLLTAHGSRGPTARVPNVTIKDRPRFAWRGLMLDSARHFQSVADIKRLIDWMALHKLNVLHWHLTDDQGWRLEIKRYPKLTSVGACRKAIGPDAALTGGSDKPYCGFYTQAQARELVHYAARRFITIVPEIEMPGHAQAAIAAYPRLGVTGKRPPVSTDWGIHTYLYNARDSTFRFLENVLDEVMAIFPSTYIHVGGDEAAKDQWQASPAIQKRMRELGIATEDGLQSWFIARIGRYLYAHGRRLIGWDEILEGGLPPDATVMSWRGVKGAIAATGQGHDVVLSPSPTLYLDHLQGSAHDEPPGRPQVISLKDVYDFDPLPPQIGAAGTKYVLGVQANLWTEYMPTFARDQHAVFPRVAALAEVAWSPASARDWHSFLARLPAQFARYRALGIGYADSAFEPRVSLKPDDNKIEVSLHTQTGAGAIRYTTDGGRPTPASPRYRYPLTLTPPLTLTAATFDGHGEMLASPRTRRIGAAALFTRNSDQLDTCTDKVVLRIEDDRPLAGPRPVYKVDIMNTCWQWKAAPVEGRRRIAVTVGEMPWNYQLWKDISGVVVRSAGRYPALDVHVDGCNGRRIAHLSLREAAANPLQTTLTAPLPALTGRHWLCFIVTGDPRQGLWGIDTVRLLP